MNIETSYLSNMLKQNPSNVFIQQTYELGHEKMCPHVICEQQRRRSACASAQSDQRLCFSLLRWFNTSRFYSRNFKTLASFCGCADRFVSGLVGNSRRHVLTCRGSYTFRLTNKFIQIKSFFKGRIGKNVCFKGFNIYRFSSKEHTSRIKI